MRQLRRGSRVSIARGLARYSHLSSDTVRLSPRWAKATIGNAVARTNDMKKEMTFCIFVSMGKPVARQTSARFTSLTKLKRRPVPKQSSQPIVLVQEFPERCSHELLRSSQRQHEVPSPPLQAEQRQSLLTCQGWLPVHLPGCPWASQ